MRGLVGICVLVFVLQGCATKQYGRVQELTPTETKFYSCRDVMIEMEKVKAFENQIEDTGGTDWKTVAGFLGDFGIGNGMAKDDAKASARARRSDLEALWVNKSCQGSLSFDPVIQSEEPESSEELSSEVSVTE